VGEPSDGPRRGGSSPLWRLRTFWQSESAASFRSRTPQVRPSQRSQWAFLVQVAATTIGDSYVTADKAGGRANHG
jgi:hypothetical protein